jgi:phosphatidylinositol kinase/protein kinase (PI-3  family)
VPTPTVIQRLEMFQNFCSNTVDTSLREAIWLKSERPDVWFTHKSNFARSTAVMSIVGYIIGMGDRHLSNILFMKNSGNVVHIDFSDCFEVAMKRPEFPERVPFRLTRMMIRVFGIAGVHGVFSKTATFVMNLMRRNQAALLAFLDIFEHPRCEQQNCEKVKCKLNGDEFNGFPAQNAEEQVFRLIEAATSDYNLCQMYIGWQPQF